MRALLMLVLLLMPGCTATRIEGECVYTREIKIEYRCEPGGTLRQRQIDSPQ